MIRALLYVGIGWSASSSSASTVQLCVHRFRWSVIFLTYRHLSNFPRCCRKASGDGIGFWQSLWKPIVTNISLGQHDFITACFYLVTASEPTQSHRPLLGMLGHQRSAFVRNLRANHSWDAGSCGENRSFAMEVNPSELVPMQTQSIWVVFKNPLSHLFGWIPTFWLQALGDPRSTIPMPPPKESFAYWRQLRLQLNLNHLPCGLHLPCYNWLNQWK